MTDDRHLAAHTHRWVVESDQVTHQANIEGRRIEHVDRMLTEECSLGVPGCQRLSLSPPDERETWTDPIRVARA